MVFVIEQSDHRGHCGWLMPQVGVAGTRSLGMRAHAEVFPTREDAKKAIDRLRLAFPTVTIDFQVRSNDA